MSCSNEAPWFAPELRALGAFCSDGKPLFFLLLPAIVLWRSTVQAAKHDSAARTKILASALLAIFVHYEVSERKLGFIASMHPDTQCLFYGFVLVLHLFSFMIYSDSKRDVRVADEQKRRQPQSNSTK